MQNGFCRYSYRLWLMIFKVIISAQTENDLRGILEEITFELLSSENTEKQLDRLEKLMSTNGSKIFCISPE